MDGFYSYEGANVLPETRESKPYDMNCPEIGKGLNYHKKLCEERQGSEEYTTSCSGGCRHLRKKPSSIEEERRVRTSVKKPQISKEQYLKAKELLSYGLGHEKTGKAVGVSKFTAASIAKGLFDECFSD